MWKQNAMDAVVQKNKIKKGKKKKVKEKKKKRKKKKKGFHKGALVWSIFSEAWK